MLRALHSLTVLIKNLRTVTTNIYFQKSEGSFEHFVLLVSNEERGLTFTPSEVSMKTWLWSLALVVWLAWAPTAQAQIPVTDAASLTEQITLRDEQAMKWAVQIDEMRLQYQQLKNSYESLTKARNLGDIFDDPLLRSYLPEEWVALYDQINKFGYNAMTQAQRNIYASNQAFDACKRIKDEDERLTCEALAIQAAVKKGHLVPAVQMIAKRSLQIKELQKRMAETEDMKEAAEIQGRISAEQAQIVNTQTEMQLFQQESAVEKELLEQRAYEQGAKDFAKRGYIVPEPMYY